MLKDRMAAEDIVQTVFLKLYEHVDSIRQKESINFWLFTTARNEVYQYIRKKQRKPEDVLDYELPKDEDITGRIEEKELRELIDKELEAMKPEMREVYILKEYSGLSYKEICDVMNIDMNLVKSRLFKVRQKLIRNIADVL